MNTTRGLSFLFILLIAISGAAAQDQNQSESKDILVELDQATWISDINWDPQNSSQVEVTIQSEVPKLVYLQELPDYQGRSGSFSPMKNYNLNSGENIVMVPYNGRQTQGIAITSGNKGAYYRKEPNNIPDPSPIDAIFIAIYGAVSTFLTFIILRGWSKFQLKRGLIKE